MGLVPGKGAKHDHSTVCRGSAFSNAIMIRHFGTMS